eukprot:TRINITY_DN8624_c0_g1_i1.p1 TRINITY_DN8624_c0_g1~~TRINITY_DN8624_c0_g1_i1.p1  ORF type:complete len:183 (+),score=25.63 TRINITY_DN8624_c0_g1_i1:56-604(+)
MTKAVVGVGTKSALKVKAIQEAFAQIFDEVEIHDFDTDSGINEQPIGNDETLTGAINRINALQPLVSDISYTHLIAIENGIVSVGETLHIDLAYILIRLPNGESFIGTSAGVPFKHSCFEKAENIGFDTTTVGSIIADEYSCNSKDPHSFLTNGRCSRESLLIQAIVSVIGQTESGLTGMVF